MKERNVAIDVLKFFAIVLVVFGHVIQHLDSPPAYDHAAFRFIYSFHMPLFMMLAGLFASRLPSLGIWGVIKKRGVQLIVPAVSISLVGAAVMWIFGTLNGTGPFLHWMIEGAWFLKSLFVCSVLYVAALSVPPRALRVPCLLLTLAAALSVSIFTLNYMYPCFLLGALLSYRLEWLQAHCRVVCPVALAVFAPMVLCYDAQLYMAATHKLSLAFAYKVVMGCAGALFFIGLFMWVVTPFSANATIRRISRWGQATLGIYVMQIVVLEIMLPNLLPSAPENRILFYGAYAPVITAAVIAVSLLLVNLARRNKVTALLLLGQFPKTK